MKNILRETIYPQRITKKEIQNNILTSKTSTSELWPEESKLERKKKQLDRSVKLGGGGRSPATLLFLRRLHARVRRERVTAHPDYTVRAITRRGWTRWVVVDFAPPAARKGDDGRA